MGSDVDVQSDDGLERAVDLLGLKDALPTLTQNAADSLGVLADAHAWLTEHVPPDEAEHVDVVVLGSFARLEASLESDFDYLVIVHGLPSDVRVSRRLLEAIDEFIATIKTRKPGRSGLFGHITAAADLTERIGLEQDTNLSQSRRLLLLEESRSVYQLHLHEKLLRAVLERYLVDYAGGFKPGPPRFLLNDVQRYWYTLAVDYQAKRWEDASSGWGLRYLKLLNSRKIAYAGTLASLLQCDEQQPATIEYLLNQFRCRPLARLAQLALDERFDQHSALRDVLVQAEYFAKFLADHEKRNQVKAASSADAAVSNPDFLAMRKASDNLAEAITRVFFDSYLGDRCRRYLVF